ncbi:MAG: hypothetical protein IJP94_06240 [Clostridia bacterium]|nr:hypothetical protein [Clostridia bacterium]MBQ3462120.1 hypothetical protein [Clostridia bacterium]MBQ3471659.1 hypothetical protein [Clostridia bacterium]MBQ9599679.1 hypothetical protein [Clostridia bacterium]MBR0089420.1 hypothetical protein [Clostridia bacterium]
MDEMTLASEMLAEIKRTSKRWFIVSVVELGLILAIIGGFLWYLNTPVAETTTTTIDQQSDNTSTNQVIGGDIYGGKTDNNGH